MKKAYPVLVAILILGISVPVFASQIANGSFEDQTNGVSWVNSIPSWTSVPSTTSSQKRAGIFFSVNGYSAVGGKTFAAITTAGTGDSVLRSSSFTIGNITLRFSYIYVTNNTPGDTTNVDPFSVTLVTTGGTTVNLSGSLDSNLALGTIGTAPFTGPKTYDTGWQTYEIDTSALIGQSAQIEFKVTDSVLSSGATSGVLLDEVTQVPEPSTILLFGVGILGLTLYGRRRRVRATRA